MPEKKTRLIVDPESKTKEELAEYLAANDYSYVDEEIGNKLKEIDMEMGVISGNSKETEVIAAAGRGKDYYKLVDTDALHSKLKYNSAYWDSNRSNYTGKGQKVSTALGTIREAQSKGYRFIPLDDGTFTIYKDGHKVDLSESNIRGLGTNDVHLLEMFTKKHSQQKGISMAMGLATGNNAFVSDPEYLKAKEANDILVKNNDSLAALIKRKTDIRDSYLRGYNPATIEEIIEEDPASFGKTAAEKQAEADAIAKALAEADVILKDKETKEDEVAKAAKIKAAKDELNWAEQNFNMEWKDFSPLVSFGFTYGASKSIDHGDLRKTLALGSGAIITDFLSYIYDDQVGGKEFIYNTTATVGSLLQSGFERSSTTKRRSFREFLDKVHSTPVGRKKLQELGKTVLNMLKNNKVFAASIGSSGYLIYKMVEDFKDPNKKIEGNEVMALISTILKYKLAYKNKPTIVGASSTATIQSPIVTPINPGTGMLKIGGRISLQKFNNGGKLIPKGQSDDILKKKSYQDSVGLQFSNTPAYLDSLKFATDFPQNNTFVGPQYDTYEDMVGLQESNTPAYLDSLKFPTPFLQRMNRSFNPMPTTDRYTPQSREAKAFKPPPVTAVNELAPRGFMPWDAEYNFPKLDFTPRIAPVMLPTAVVKGKRNEPSFDGKSIPGTNTPAYEQGMVDIFGIPGIKNTSPLLVPRESTDYGSSGDPTLDKMVADGSVERDLSETPKLVDGVTFFKVMVPSIEGDPNSPKVVMYYNSATKELVNEARFKQLNEGNPNMKYGTDYTNNALFGPQGPLGGLAGWGDALDLGLGIYNFNKGITEQTVAQTIAPPNRPLWMPRALGATWGEKQAVYNNINNQSRTITQGSDAMANIIASVMGAGNKSQQLSAASGKFEGISRAARTQNDQYEAQNYQTAFENLKNQRAYQNDIITQTNKIDYANAVTRAEARTELFKNISTFGRVVSQNAQLKDQAIKDSVVAAHNRELNSKQQELNFLISLGEDRSSTDVARIKELRKEITDLISDSDPIKKAQYLSQSGNWWDMFKKRKYNIEGTGKKEGKERFD